MFVVADDFVGTAPVAVRKAGAMQGDAIELIGKPRAALSPLHLSQPFLNSASDGLGRGFTGQAGESLRQCVGVGIP